MKWIKITKHTASIPTSGTYKDWKPLLAHEGSYQCVYCCIHEKSFGGIRNFHVEHYRPKSKYQALINDYNNLFYACAICNTFKGNDWPSEPDDEFLIESYPNPSEVDYCLLFEYDESTGEVTGKYIASKYIVERLYLNRPQLVLERAEESLDKKCSKLMEKGEELQETLFYMVEKGNTIAIGFLRELLNINKEIILLQIEAKTVRPYEDIDTSR